MFAGLKMSSLTCKYVFYRQEHSANGDLMELNFQGLDMQK